MFTLLDDDDCDKPILKNLAAWLVNEFIQFRYMLEYGVPLYDILWKKLRQMYSRLIITRWTSCTGPFVWDLSVMEGVMRKETYLSFDVRTHDSH